MILPVQLYEEAPLVGSDRFVKEAKLVDKSIRWEDVVWVMILSGLATPRIMLLMSPARRPLAAHQYLSAVGQSSIVSLGIAQRQNAHPCVAPRLVGATVPDGPPARYLLDLHKPRLELQRRPQERMEQLVDPARLHFVIV